MTRAPLLRLLAFGLAGMLAHAPACAQPSEAAVKAAFLVKFGAYVSWPAPGPSLVLCLVGRDVLGPALEQSAAGQQIDGRAVTVKRIDTIDRGTACDIAYLAGSHAQSIQAAIAAVRAAPVLTVTDGRWSSVRGMIHFQVAQNRVRFRIDDQAAADAGLGISSKLLGLALSVRARAAR